MTTTEKNAVIAKWMGVQYLHSTTRIETLKYHSDWNWLIDCVSKIENLDNGFYFVKIHTGGCFIHPINDTKDYKAKQYGKVPIEYVYNAVFQFIQWHNSQVNQNQNP